MALPTVLLFTSFKGVPSTSKGWLLCGWPELLEGMLPYGWPELLEGMLPCGWPELLEGNALLGFFLIFLLIHSDNPPTIT